ncbi:hypothetical protein M422DRAFT_263956 [Sphaerobolus stellatus SS14]|uniref:NmrA-like domain-containing protein n=1 Tax=Sphaerobolus stellatus (strain SS14) TaxID=990650 RepID=A0A0C9TUH7_SPHS4|nr:hypothetical protein M422DRAFT_263956 [Sphaerobolus stellatus SS14]
MAHEQKPVVLLVGAAGRFGLQIVEALQATNAFDIVALVRPESLSKTSVTVLREKGVKIRPGDFSKDTISQLEDYLADVDFLISLINFTAILEQKNMFLAAKNIRRVRRVIPCDFGTACVPNRRKLYDEGDCGCYTVKLQIRTYVWDLGLPHTFIDIGWFIEFILPQIPKSEGDEWFSQFSRQTYDSENVKVAVTASTDAGEFVAKIIQDDRTINKYVFCWSEEITQGDAYKIAKSVSGYDFDAVKVHVSDEDVHRRITEAAAIVQKDPSQWFEVVKMTSYEYAYSIYICGDNTVENAKRQGGLDARTLYPDLVPKTVEQVAKVFYAQT